MDGDKRSERTLVILPAWNEQESLPRVIAEIQTTPDLKVDVLVVDDGSRDDTAAVARASGIRVLQLPLNLGVGGAMRAGYLYALRAGYEYAIQVDADGQHPPVEIPKLAMKMRETGADIVIGARFDGAGEYTVRGPRAWAMRVLSASLSRYCGTRLTDTTSGFKLANRRAMALLSEALPAEYLGDTIEAIVICKKAGLKITQVPVSMRERQGGQASHSPFKAAGFLVRALLAMLIATTRPAVREVAHA